MRALLSLLVLCCALALAGCPPVAQTELMGEVETRPAADPGVCALLDKYERSYDPAARMLLWEHHSPGYHSAIPAGAWVHPTRESLVYAVALLERDDAGDAERAAEILSRVVALQDTDPDSRTCGVWPWLLEEPLADMDKPDLNWADFCAVQLAHILTEHGRRLPVDLRFSLQESLRLATGAICRRDVRAEYTNIAIMGAEACAVAGELLDDEQLLEYGRSHMIEIAELAERNGSLSEYNSPPYTCLALAECERTLMLVDDPQTRSAAESLRQAAWQTIAESYHPATEQWAGPHARAHDRLRASTVEFLMWRTGLAMATHPSAAEYGYLEWTAVIDPLPCPENLSHHFRDSSGPPRELVRTFVQREETDEVVIGTTWLAEEACLGSASESIFWTQRRPLIGYWRTDEEPAVMLRLRFLHEGQDFASVGVSTAQHGPRALSICYPERNRGDWHPSLDRPEDGMFHATDLRLRYELRGEGVRGEDLGDGRYALVAGDWRVVIHTLPGTFDGRTVLWRLGQGEDNVVFVSGVCYRADERAFDFSGPLGMRLAAGIEILQEGETPTDTRPRFAQSEDGSLEVVWELPEAQGGELRVEHLDPLEAQE